MSKNQSQRTLKEDIVQAVVFADPFNDNFVPFSKLISPCLLPLANRPLLEYTLHSLSAGGVNEVILFCSTFPEQIKQFINDREWGDLTIFVIVSEGCRSVGDAMRDLDAKALIRSDFILVSGFQIANLNYEMMLKKHSEFRKLDLSGQTIAMTVLFKDGGQRRNHSSQGTTYIMDSSTNRILWQNKSSTKNEKVKIPMEIILSGNTIDICHGLLETKVYICSNNVPPLFSDNFDFQTMDDFIRGLLMNEEIIASTLYGHVLQGANYAATLESWADYQAITNDLLHRWTFPLVPDVFNKYSFHKRSVYLGKNITLSVGCSLEESVVIGDKCSIGENTFITGSVLGNNCSVGSNVKLEGCYVFDNVVIENDCDLSYSVIGENCRIGAGAKLSQGCILGPNVVIDAKKNVSALRLQSTLVSSEDQVCIGPQAYTCPLESDDSDSDSDDDDAKPASGGRGLIFQAPDWKNEALEEDDSSDSDVESMDEIGQELDDTKIFYQEVLDSLIRGYSEKVPCDNLILEINSSRYAYNVTLRELNCLVMKAVLRLPAGNASSVSSYWELLQNKLSFFDPIMKKYIKNEESQKDCLLAIEDATEEDAMLCDVSMKLLHYLYNEDFLESDVIESWYKQSSDSDHSKVLRSKIQRFITWLQELESGSEEESDSE
ncbi:hypothetical protein LSTR_LSTR012251 [Laodelphax striatellus]|uniref:Translation initiation factor eIF2B subunit epsilon n=1 Tax=Laodelphax striatellus TaxID=195883 RepID=A0A482WK69_LAOST|nr:hypothetical protein LSTR_LSTR012251 [Laodelphax striatellus]